MDDYSRYTWVHFLSSKAETPSVIIKFIKRIQVGIQAQVRFIRTDNGTEFTNQILQNFFDSIGITHQRSVAYTPQQNSVVERRNRTLVEVARTVLSSANLPFNLWSKVMSTACLTQNRSIINKRFNKTPYHILHKRKADVKYLRTFRCRCYL